MKVFLKMKENEKLKFLVLFTYFRKTLILINLLHLAFKHLTSF